MQSVHSKQDILIDYVLMIFFQNLDDPDAAVKTAIEDVQQICKFAIDTNASIWLENTSNGTQKLVRPTKLLGKMCPSQCSFQGNCTNGTCTCLPKFTGSDCSFEVGKIPRLTYLVGSSLCNIRNRSCDAVTVIGKDFADTSKLTCKGSKNDVSLASMFNFLQSFLTLIKF